jgi:RND superfamily putative drug exporter
MLVGGIPAFNADYRGALTGRFVTVASVVVIATLLVLGVALRSILVPLKAVALNLLSVAAAFGAMVLVFGDGAGVGLLGLDAAPGGTFPIIPVLVFCIVFGLSMDYELFLVSRIAEARRTGANESDAIVAGVVHTGGVITSAAAIMIVVFGAFMLGDVLLVQMLGFALAVAVLIDATIVRLAIGPALLRLAGRWNWWPGRKGKGAEGAGSAEGAEGGTSSAPSAASAFPAPQPLISLRGAPHDRHGPRVEAAAPPPLRARGAGG